MTQIVMPGDRIAAAEELAKSKKVILGPGLRREDEQVVAFKAGKLRHKEPNTFWVDNYQRRYVPVRGDYVIGLVTAKAGDIFRVDIGAHEQSSKSFVEQNFSSAYLRKFKFSGQQILKFEYCNE